MVPTTSLGRRNGKQQAAVVEETVAGNGGRKKSARGKTVTPPKPAPRRGRKPPAGPGLVVERRWTTAGVDPFDEVEWDYRTAAITGEKGETVFEQRDVEVPRTWSQLATNVVVSKYFRGHLGDPAREHSVKQLIGRVVQTISGWGREQGYFASEADADAFRDELSHILVHQKAAFNSPVWFNVGLPDNPRPQASACQPYDAPVNTPVGRIPIGQIVENGLVGLEVCDTHGTTRVVAVKHNARKPVLRIHTESGHTLDVTPDHLVFRMRSGASGRFVEAGTLRPGDRLAWHRTMDDADKVPDPRMIAEAALAGWLQTDGFVGQYEHGTNRSLTIEALTMNDEEFEWVLSAVRTVFPDIHYHVREVTTQDVKLKGRRIRLYGEVLRPFVEAWGLLARGTAMAAPDRLAHAPLAVVTAYLKSVFQAEGYVSVRGNAGGQGIGLSMVAPRLVHDLQRLLARMGIFGRVSRVSDPRPSRNDSWVLAIRNEGDRRLFAERVGFVDTPKTERLVTVCKSGDVPGNPARERKSLHIDRIEALGEMDVYDIQTESGEYLSGNLRVHNCFINSVEDTMESIMLLAATEARLFKGGSGAGSNLSRIRSSKEPLQGGGIASGPVSFMRGYDAFAGVIKSGGKTRRAAKMQLLDVDHPDIVEFIKCKADEEKKAWSLIEAGYDGGFNVPGGAYDSVYFQNANLSVRVSDEFMHAVESNGDWRTRYVLSKEVADTFKARDILRMVAEGTHVCGDPGLQFDTTINRWHTCKATDRIYASNPCSEFVFLDDTACNLASLNLMRFRKEDGEFDVADFIHGCEIVITAQEILVDNASYPTEKIGINSHEFRPLGLGYANLGALLMSRGMPYDSDAGRALAGAITAVMTGAGYRQSARIAEHKGPFPGYAPNREAMLEVMALHRSHIDKIDDTLVPNDLMEAAHQVWDETLDLGRKHGYKNAQISVLAPTGTIAFFMDCDTTGIEPDIALVKYKTLVGGGVMKIVNQTVPEALRRLGYAEKQVSAIVDYIDANGTIEGAPGLRDEDLPVFDCAFRAASGTRSIHYMGHVRMMAAAQPFISGAISKTVNVPEEATVEEIEQTYIEAWKQGLKAVAIYRDNSKRTQPLSTKKGGEIAKAVEGRPFRRKLPDERQSITHKFSIAGHEGYVTVGKYEDGTPGEIFITMSKEGSTISGLMDSFATAISLALQYGVPLHVLVNKFSHARFEPSGWTNNKEIPIAKSVMDYIFRWLAIKFLPTEAQPEPEATMTNGHAKEVNALVPSERMLLQEDAPPCSDCGAIMVRAGACYRCLNCGSTSGCG